MADLPCDGDGACMKCKAAPAPEAELVLCRMCATPWHAPCLSRQPETLAAVADWQCPDCSPSPTAADAAPVVAGGDKSELVAAIRAIQADPLLSDQEKARRRQALLAGGGEGSKSGGEKGSGGGGIDVLEQMGESLNCSFCMQLPDRPVTTPCGHNFCLKCFQRWVGQGKLTCAKCRTAIPSKMASQPRINSVIVEVIRMAKMAKKVNWAGPAPVYQYVRNENRPDKAFTTERAKKTGKANACSGQIFVTVPPDHFGPILAEHDPRNNTGVRVGQLWEDRLECRQWGAHLPHVAGIAGQSDYGAQSVALSGGYEDDEDHGEWFLYTGSGGRDLSGNKRTNKEQSFDQKFEKYNAALRVSCMRGYPVRVVRSHKEKRSSYAPETGVRYDGIYRIEKCWRKVGIQGFKVCRYLFVRCDNEPAPWTCDEHGDRPRPLPKINELKGATDITQRTETAAWDYNQEKEDWRWMKPPPVSRKPVISGNSEEAKRARKAARAAQHMSVQERLLKEFNCLKCKKVMAKPVTTPCGHNFCKDCLLGAFADPSFVRQRGREGGRTLRVQKIVKKCPACPTDICDFLQNPQINRELMDLIETLKRKSEEEINGHQDERANEEAEECSEDGSDDNSEEKQQCEGGTESLEKNAIKTSEDDKSLKKEECDGPKDNKMEPADGDSDMAVGPENDDVEAKDAAPPSRKRKGNAARGRGGKRTKKSAEVDDDGVEEKDTEMEEDGDKNSKVATAEAPSSTLNAPDDE